MVSYLPDFLIECTEENRLTSKVIRASTAESLKVRAFGNGYSFAEYAEHLTDAYLRISPMLGLEISDVSENKPLTPASIANRFDRVALRYRSEIEQKLQDDALLEIRLVYGEAWTIKHTLSVMLRHEIHHRAQMVVLLRIAGIRPPDIYGPAGDF